MPNITIARTAKNEKFLNTLIRTSAYGICTRARRLDQALAYKLIVKTVTGVQTTGFESRELAQRAANRALGNGAIDVKVEKEGSR